MPRHPFTDTRERIERAALDLFVAKGVAETTVRDIAQRVDISEGALYRHFLSKDDLVWRLFERHYVALAARLDSLAASKPSAREKIAAMIRGFCEAHDEDPTLYRFLLFVQHGQLAKLGERTHTPVTVVHAVVEQAIVRGDLPPQDADLATAIVFGIVLQPVTFAAYGRLPQAQGPTCDRLVSAAWAALRTI